MSTHFANIFLDCDRWSRNLLIDQRVTEEKKLKKMRLGFIFSGNIGQKSPEYIQVRSLAAPVQN